MKIGIEAQRLFRRRKHGMDLAALELIRNLQKIDKKNDYVIFVKPDEDKECLKESANLKIVKVEARNFGFWEQVALPLAARKEKLDILHCTSNTAPWFPGVPTIVTLHDIIYLEGLRFLTTSNSWYHRFGSLYRRIIVPRVIKKAQRLITVSEFEKQRICNYLHLPVERVSVAYNGVGEHFKPVNDLLIMGNTRQKYNLPGRFILFMGSNDPKKNVTGTLEGYADYMVSSTHKLPLVLLDFDEDRVKDVLSSINHPGLFEKIILPGYVNNSDLPALYSLADVFLFPSFRESFGLPPLESMACGTPVISSTTSSMPEVCGDGALLVDPFKPSDIAQAILRITGDRETQQRLIQNGFKRVEKFSWQNTAMSVIEVYTDVYEQNQRKKM
jgi:glycosyltransferase involved in cell wall biosynthesis